MKPEIVRFHIHDIPFGKILTDKEGWNRSVTDWQRLVRLDPEAVFKAVHDGRDAGVVGVLRYENVAWIHSLIVMEGFRGMGVARLLMQSCLDIIRSSGIRTIKLDSVQGVERFYGKFGFIREFDSMRFVGKESASDGGATRIESDDLDDICSFDLAQTGIDRGRVLREIHYDTPDRSFMINEDGEVLGYIMGRTGDAIVHVGPCICAPGREDVATRLLRSETRAGTNRYRFCIAGNNPRALRFAESNGLEPSSAAIRMYLGEPLEESESCCAMISAEKG